MKWIVFERLANEQWVNRGTADTRDDGDRVQLESEAVRQLATSSGVYAVVPFDEWSLHEAEARIVSHPVPRGPQTVEQAEVETDTTTAETGDDTDMDGLVQPGASLP